MTRRFWPGTTTLDPYNICGDEVKPGDNLGYKVIAVIDGTGKGWAAYYGRTDQSDEEIAREGDKLFKDQAEPLFPTLARNLTYRR